MRMIRDDGTPLKPGIVLVLCIVGALACGGDGRALVAPGAAPAWAERVVPPRVPGDRPPLLVLLHGLGGDEDDLARLAPWMDERFQVVSLRAPRRYGTGHSWFTIDVRRNGTMRPHADQAREALLDLARWLAAAPARLGTDPDRTYVLGFSQGAMMAVGLVRTHPEQIAGAVVLSGSAVDEVFPVVAPRAAVARVAVFVAHGTKDELLPVANGQAIRDSFLGLAPDLTYREYPIAHGVNEDAMEDVAAWLTARLDGVAP